MQVTETKTEGLLHEFSITIPAADIELVVEKRLEDLKKTAKVAGFRPGKVPVSLLRKKFGSSIMGEVLERTVGETSSKVLQERSLRPIIQPKIEVKKFEDGIDLEYTMSIEVLPDIELMDFSKIILERMVVEVDEKEIDQAVDRVADAHKTSKPISGSRKSRKGDVLIIDFVGKIDEAEFPGGRAEDYSLELGSGSFIPGFEDQLIGVKAGDHVNVNVSFPDKYAADELAGKKAIFEVEVKEIHETSPASIDDELAKKVGIENLETLKINFREEHDRELKSVARQRLKRSLLDQLEENHDFEIPKIMENNEFENIWNQFKQHRKQAEDSGSKDDPSEGKSEDELNKDFRDIAQRRVRLGLILAEIGRINNIEVDQGEINQAMMTEAKRYPGQEQMVMDYFNKNTEAIQQLKEPLMEEKVVDFIIELATVTEKKVSMKELMKEPDQELSQKKRAVKKSKTKKKVAANKKGSSKK